MPGVTLLRSSTVSTWTLQDYTRALDCSVQEGTGWGPWRRWWSPSEGRDRACLLSQRGNSASWLVSAPSTRRTTRGHILRPGLGSGSGVLGEGNSDLLTLKAISFQLPPWEQGKTTLSYGFSLSLLYLLPAWLFVDDLGSRVHSVHFFCFLCWFYRNYKVINTQCENIQITNSIDIYNGISENTTLLLLHHSQLLWPSPNPTLWGQWPLAGIFWGCDTNFFYTKNRPMRTRTVSVLLLVVLLT